MDKFKTVSHKKVLFGLLTFVISVVSCSTRNSYKRVPSFTCNYLGGDYKNRELTLCDYDCNIQIDYEDEESKLSGKCEFYVDNESKGCCYKRYRYKVHVDFEDSSYNTIFSEFSYPHHIMPLASQHVTFMVRRQEWDRSRMIAHISPRIEVLHEQVVCSSFCCCCLPKCCCAVLIFLFSSIFYFISIVLSILLNTSYYFYVGKSKMI